MHINNQIHVSDMAFACYIFPVKSQESSRCLCVHKCKSIAKYKVSEKDQVDVCVYIKVRTYQNTNNE